ESLLRFDRRGEQFIEQPAIDVAAKMIAHEEPESLLGPRLCSHQNFSLFGAGGMSVGYQASGTKLKRSVAIKVLPADRVSDRERKRRFVQEARAASALNHPNIITIPDRALERATAGLPGCSDHTGFPSPLWGWAHVFYFPRVPLQPTVRLAMHD